TEVFVIESLSISVFGDRRSHVAAPGEAPGAAEPDVLDEARAEGGNALAAVLAHRRIEDAVAAFGEDRARKRLAFRLALGGVGIEGRMAGLVAQVVQPGRKPGQQLAVTSGVLEDPRRCELPAQV